jgi:hypothetical protein
VNISRISLTFLAASVCLALSPTAFLSAQDTSAERAAHDISRHQQDDGKDKHKSECEDHEGGDPASDRDEECGCMHASARHLKIMAPGVSLQAPSSLLSAFVITNTGDETRKHVNITAITLPGGTLTLPAMLPVRLGTLRAGKSARMVADFDGSFMPSSTYPLTLHGTFKTEHETHCFTLKAEFFTPPDAPGSAEVQRTTAFSATVQGAPFPHQRPSSDNDVDLAAWTVPTNPFVIPSTPTPFATSPQRAPIGTSRQEAPMGAPPAINFVVNNSWGIGQSNTAEPSGATGRGVVFVTSNKFAAYSTDGGGTFTRLDPTTIFPADAVGFCCDQIVQYVPLIDRFVWLLQGPTGNRLASASSADLISSKGTAWTYWNLTPDVFGQTGGSFDYPDLSVGSNYLYMSWNVSNGSNGGHLVARTSLIGLEAGGTIQIDYTTPKDSRSAWGGHLSQDTGDEVFWAGQKSNSELRIFSLKEGSTRYFWQDVRISTWANNAPLSSTTPDGKNWIDFLFNPTTQNPGGGFPSNAVLGLTRDFSNHVWFAWSAGTDSNFSRPHVEMVALNINNKNPPTLSVNQQVQIWNSAYTFAYPALATNACTGEIGFSLEGGGDGNYENHLVGFWGDFVAYITTGSAVGSTRFGDYVTIRRSPATEANPGNLFDAFGYGINAVSPPGTGKSDPHYVLFGRPASSCHLIP